MKMITIPAINALKRVSMGTHTTRGAMIPTAMATPPALGTGETCTFLSSGTSTMPSRKAPRLTSGVSVTVT